MKVEGSTLSVPTFNMLTYNGSTRSFNTNGHPMLEREQMRHRIRAAGLLVDGDRLLLVLHRNVHTGEEWWVPPGGGMEPCDVDAFDTTKRELFEETGLTGTVSRIAYVREFREVAQETHHLELFMPVDSWSGELTLDNLVDGDVDSALVADARWLTRDEMTDRVVYPEWLKDDWFWQDAVNGFAVIRYTGLAEE